jgi:hypothetical protein
MATRTLTKLTHLFTFNKPRTVALVYFSYGNGNFCTLNCQNDWTKEYMDRAVDYFGRLTQPLVMTEENSWAKRENYYSWQRENNEPRYYFLNILTREERAITEHQFNDNNYTKKEAKSKFL